MEEARAVIVVIYTYFMRCAPGGDINVDWEKTERRVRTRIKLSDICTFGLIPCGDKEKKRLTIWSDVKGQIKITISVVIAAFINGINE